MRSDPARAPRESGRELRETLPSDTSRGSGDAERGDDAVRLVLHGYGEADQPKIRLLAIHCVAVPAHPREFRAQPGAIRLARTEQRRGRVTELRRREA